MTTIKQMSFVGGELAPSLYGRVDQSKYQSGARTMRNFFVMRHGGVSNRPGMEWIAEVNDSSTTVRLIPFIFNSDQTYVLEFGNLYFRVYRNGALSYNASQSVTSISEANPAVVTKVAHGYNNGDEINFTDVVGAMGTYLANRNFKVANSAANTFELEYMDGTAVDSTSFGTFTSGNMASVYQVTTTYATADLSTLDYAQSGDIITIVHPSYVPREVARTEHTAWTITDVSFAPTTASTSGISVTSSGTGGDKYLVTAVDDDTSEEGRSGTAAESSVTASSGTPLTVSWTAPAGTTYRNIYKEANGVYGFIGIATGTSFVDDGIEPDMNDTYPEERNPFNATNDYPSAVTYVQQRQTFANTNNNPEKIWMSRSGNYKNFDKSTPVLSDDPVEFTLAGRQVNEVQQLIDLGTFVVLTTGGEWAILGDAAGVVKPTDINPKQNSYNGSASLKPIIVANSALYVQSRGTIIRDLIYDLQENGYKGNDLTIFSAHLFDNYTIVDWAYQQIPHSIVWVARSDGKLLGLTYVREHQIWGWHIHDTDGLVENVVVIPSGSRDEVWLVVKRTINGNDVRYVERMSNRFEENTEDMILMDSALSFDGTHSGSTTMTLSGGSTWAYDETLTLTASASFFDSSMVGEQIHLTGSDGTKIRFTIEAYSSTTVVTGKPNKTVPATMRSIAVTVWGRAIKDLTGLWHIEGKNVAVFADKFVLASPNNAAYTTTTVTNGEISLSEHHVVIHVGLPYLCDLETLDIDTPAGESIVADNKIVREVSAQLESSRGMWAGPRPPSDDTTDPLEDLVELKIREDESYDDPVDLTTDSVTINIETEWNSNGRVFLRQVDPIPLSILSVAAHGVIPFKNT